MAAEHCKTTTWVGNGKVIGPRKGCRPVRNASRVVVLILFAALVATGVSRIGRRSSANVD